MWHVCFSKVSVEVADAADEVGNRKFTCGCFRCLLEVRMSQRGSGMVELGLGKDMANKDSFVFVIFNQLCSYLTFYVDPRPIRVLLFNNGDFIFFRFLKFLLQKSYSSSIIKPQS